MGEVTAALSPGYLSLQSYLGSPSVLPRLSSLSLFFLLFRAHLPAVDLFFFYFLFPKEGERDRERERAWRRERGIERERERERKKTVIISAGFHAGLVCQEEDRGSVFALGFFDLHHHHLLLLLVFFLPPSLGAPFGQYRTAERSLDEPPRRNPEMELLLICLSLWILQCNSAKADSIIHIGKQSDRVSALCVFFFFGWGG